MKKALFFLLISSLSFAQLTAEEDAIATAVMTRDLTKQEQIALDKYMDKKFINVKTFMSDTEKIVKAGLYIPTEYEAECAGRLIASANKDGYNLTKWDYEELWDAAGNFCREYVDPYRNNTAKKHVEKIEINTSEPEPKLTASRNEQYEYKTIQFAKTKTGYNFKSEVPTVLQEKIKEDFSKDGPGNYTAFYDVFSVNDVPDRITLKARLNR